MFLLIGLGPAPPGTLQLAAREALQTADVVYLENYTNLGYDRAAFEAFLGRSVLPAPRSVVENDELLRSARTSTVALCVLGDIFSATTHSTLYLDCRTQNIPCRVFPNAGVMNTIALTGLELYKFGQTVSIPYPVGDYKPTSYREKIDANRALGLHTLCLLDIKADENRFMTIPEALELLSTGLAEPLTAVIGVARLCAEDMVVRAGTPQTLLNVEWGAQPHCLVIPGTLNAVEEEFVAQWTKTN
jgi:diphthine synthase